MRKSRTIACTVLSLLILQGPLSLAAFGAAAPSAAKAPAKAAAAGKKASGKQLTTSARQALAGMMKAAKASKGQLDPKNKKQAPFWSAADKMNKTLKEIERQAAAKDKKLSATLASGTRTLAQMKTVWPRTGAKSAAVEGYLGKLDNSYAALRGAFGAEGARARKGGALSAQEKASFVKIQAKQKEFSAKLAPMVEKAKKDGDKGMEKNLTRMVAQSERISGAAVALDSFLTLLILLDNLQGEWAGYSYYVGPSYQAAWTTVDTWYDTASASYDVLYTETFDVYAVDAASSWDTYTEFDSGFDYEVTDVTVAEIDSLGASFDADFTYDEMSWESYSAEFADAEMEAAIFEEEAENLDVAAEALEAEGLELEAAEALMDAEDAAELAEAAADEADEAEAAADDDDEDNDGIANDEDADDDGDGVADDADADDDNDGVADDEDADDDNDGVADDEEGEDDGGDDEGEDDGGVDEGDDDGGDDDSGDDGGGDDDGDGMTRVAPLA